MLKAIDRYRIRSNTRHADLMAIVWWWTPPMSIVVIPRIEQCVEREKRNLLGHNNKRQWQRITT